MKQLIALSIFLCVLVPCSGQKIGEQKIISEFAFISYECGDFCHFEFKDSRKSESDFIDRISNKADPLTRQLLKEITQKCELDENCGLKGQRYSAVLIFQSFDEYDLDGKPTGNKNKEWAFLKLRKILPKPITFEGIITDISDCIGTGMGTCRMHVKSNSKKYIAEYGYVHYEPNFNHADFIDQMTLFNWGNGNVDKEYGLLRKGMHVKVFGKIIHDGTIYALKVDVIKK